MLLKSLSKKTSSLTSSLAITVSLVSFLTTIQPSIAKTSVDTQVSLGQTELLLARFPRPRPGWLNRIPRRSFNGWIDEAQGIYRTNRGSIVGAYGKLGNLSPGQRRALLGITDRNVVIEAHHLIERRMATIFGVHADDLPAVLIRRGEHRGRDNSIHNLINQIIPRGRNYRNALPQIQQAYQRIYAAHDDWLDAITATISWWANP